LNTTARIVLLNGVGSAGKGSLARALQTITAEPFLHVTMDSFMAMLPEAYENHPDSFTYETVIEGGKPSVVITTGPIGERTLRGMRYAVGALAAQGNNLIVDDVMLGGERAEYAAILSGFEVYWVGVFAPLDVLEDRERQRGDRLIGLARWQFDRVHNDMRYDLEIDTSTATPLACARRIKDKFNL
jgi:chloramphenicol 3-O phosphotransferase